jgi:hypothetical protein
VTSDTFKPEFAISRLNPGSRMHVFWSDRDRNTGEGDALDTIEGVEVLLPRSDLDNLQPTDESSVPLPPLPAASSPAPTSSKKVSEVDPRKHILASVAERPDDPLDEDEFLREWSDVSVSRWGATACGWLAS